MAHTPIEFLIDPVSGVKSIEANSSQGNHRLIVRQDDIDFMTFETEQNDANTEPHEDDAEVLIRFTPFFAGAGSAPFLATEAEATQIKGFFAGSVVEIDANGKLVNVGTDDGDDAVPELQLVQDPVIYNRPETGLSQRNIPFFKFHNPNGKSAITISMTDVDHTRFDSNSDDTHHYVVVTKARIEIRCLCTVNEQLGLEFRFRGTTHVISAEESNNVRLITESRDNPQ